MFTNFFTNSPTINKLPPLHPRPAPLQTLVPLFYLKSRSSNSSPSVSLSAFSVFQRVPALLVATVASFYCLNSVFLFGPKKELELVGLGNFEVGGRGGDESAVGHYSCAAGHYLCAARHYLCAARHYSYAAGHYYEDFDRSFGTVVLDFDTVARDLDTVALDFANSGHNFEKFGRERVSVGRNFGVDDAAARVVREVEVVALLHSETAAAARFSENFAIAAPIDF